MGDLRKVILSKFGLSAIWPDVWYSNDTHYSGDILKVRLYSEVFRYIFFWGFSFSPLFTLRQVHYYLDSGKFVKLNRLSYFKFKKKVVKYSRGNFLSKISALNYYNFIILVFYIYLPSKYKDKSKVKRIFRLKLFTNSLLTNFRKIYSAG